LAHPYRSLNLLLASNTNSATTATSGLGVLSSHSDSPVVTKSTMGSDLLESLEIITELDIEIVGNDLRGLSVLDILLSVEEPVWDLELAGMVDDCNDFVDLLVCELSGSLVDVNLSLLADNVRESATTTLDVGQGVHHLSSSLDICILNTKNVLKVILKN